MKIKALILFLMVATINVNAQKITKPGAEGIPQIPVGIDAFRQWEKWPNQRIGVRAYMRSTYDREGGNQSADASHFLFANEEDHNVTLDVKGKGMLCFFRTNHWHGSPWHFIVDGVDNIVQENGTSDPENAKKNFRNTEFIPSSPFPKPLNWTWATTKGADLIWTPMLFEESLRIAYSRTRYGTGYYIYHLYADEKNLSQPIQTWDIKETPDQDVITLIDKTGADIAPLDIKRISGKRSLDNERVLLANIPKTSGSIRALKISIPLDKAMDLEQIRLIATWDGSKYPSIDAPLCLFYGAGTFYNRDEREFLVKGFPINVRYDYDKRKVELACYYPMPFFKSAKFELAGIKPDHTDIEYEIRYEPLKVSEKFSSYFHATYKDIPSPEMGKDMIFLDTKGIEGQNDWSGNFVGNSFIFSHNGFLGTLEGDPRFFFDDSKSPQAYGTGTEEWGGGGDYWGGQNMTLPFAGHPCGAVNKEKAKSEKDMVESAYRFLLSDLMPFGFRAKICFEHGGENLSTEHYSVVSYWYGLPAPSLIKTDEIDIGNLISENRHNYSSNDTSSVYSISSRYELGIDKLPRWGSTPTQKDVFQVDNSNNREIYPAHSEDGRITSSLSQITISVTPENEGVLLRRTLDYSIPNQTAEVLILKDSSRNIWEKVGIWYLAGSNTCLYSDANGELATRWLRTKTSNRRFRDDEFLIPAKFTRGKKELQLQFKVVPNDQQLFPDFPFPKKSAWSELRYEVYCYVIPQINKF